MTSSILTKQNKPVFKRNVPDDQFKMQPLPSPSGTAPFHLQLNDVSPVNVKNRMVFQMVGDTGSAKQPEFQRLVAAEMISQFQAAVSPEDQPLFLYHLGDVVYHFGEAEEYYRQFFEPYKNYPAPIFAIAGNHDSDVNASTKNPYKSLEAFTHVFCNAQSRVTALAEGTRRKTMVQPHVYFTLKTPLAIIIGLYSNVPKFGAITAEQKNWFINELTQAGLQKKDKALIVCIHHAPYSADTNHGSSQPMIEFLENAYSEAGVRPHIVFSGHVHNYQRFTRTCNDGTTIPYIVAGAGGYATLFPIAAVDDPAFCTGNALLNNVELNNFCDDKHGFLKVSIEKTNNDFTLTGEYFTIPHVNPAEQHPPVQMFDRFVLNLG